MTVPCSIVTVCKWDGTIESMIWGSLLAARFAFSFCDEDRRGETKCLVQACRVQRGVKCGVHRQAEIINRPSKASYKMCHF